MKPQFGGICRVDPSLGTKGRNSFRSFYTRSRESNGFFTVFPTIVMTMSNSSRRVRQITLGLVVLAAVGHANLATDLSGRAPNTSGMTRLGRDLLRKSAAEPCSRADHIYSFFTDHQGDSTAILRAAALV
jgi:hypothetical protein